MYAKIEIGKRIFKILGCEFHHSSEFLIGPFQSNRHRLNFMAGVVAVIKELLCDERYAFVFWREHDRLQQGENADRVISPSDAIGAVTAIVIDW